MASVRTEEQRLQRILLALGRCIARLDKTKLEREGIEFSMTTAQNNNLEKLHYLEDTLGGLRPATGFISGGTDISIKMDIQYR